MFDDYLLYIIWFFIGSIYCYYLNKLNYMYLYISFTIFFILLLIRKIINIKNEENNYLKNEKKRIIKDSINKIINNL